MLCYIEVLDDVIVILGVDYICIGDGKDGCGEIVVKSIGGIMKFFFFFKVKCVRFVKFCGGSFYLIMKGVKIFFNFFVNLF